MFEADATQEVTMVKGVAIGLDVHVLRTERITGVQAMVSECRFEHPDGVRAATHAVIVKDERFAALHRQ